MTLNEADLGYVRRLVHERAGIVVDSGNDYLVESRLQPLVRQAGFASLAELIMRLRGDRTHALHAKVVESMTTNETSFFRDGAVFEVLGQTILPAVFAGGASEPRIWSAACSSGQEPYSVALCLHARGLVSPPRPITILGTDLSQGMLLQARSGRYSQVEVSRGVPPSVLAKYFARQGTQWEISAEIRAMVDFRELNLAGPWPPLARFDVILLRNVLMYFDHPTRKAILAKVRRSLRPDGVLFLGAAETIGRLDPAFRHVTGKGGGYYRLVSS